MPAWEAPEAYLGCNKLSRFGQVPRCREGEGANCEQGKGHCLLYAEVYSFAPCEESCELIINFIVYVSSWERHLNSLHDSCNFNTIETLSLHHQQLPP